MWVGFQAGLIIFGLRIIDISFYTMRLMMLSRGLKARAALFAFLQSFTFVVAIRTVLTNLDQPWIVFGYAAGFATGLVVGMLIEARLAVGFTHLRIISSKRGNVICEGLRAEGYAVTEIPARGRDGMVTLLECDVLRKDTGAVTCLVEKLDTESFITAENVRSVRRGYWHR